MPLFLLATLMVGCVALGYLTGLAHGIGREQRKWEFHVEQLRRGIRGEG